MSSDDARTRRLRERLEDLIGSRTSLCDMEACGCETSRLLQQVYAVLDTEGDRPMHSGTVFQDLEDAKKEIAILKAQVEGWNYIKGRIELVLGVYPLEHDSWHANIIAAIQRLQSPWADTEGDASPPPDVWPEERLALIRALSEARALSAQLDHDLIVAENRIEQLEKVAQWDLPDPPVQP